MSTPCSELMVQLKNIRKVQNNLNMMIEVCSNFKYNPASMIEIKSRQIGDIYKIKNNLIVLLEQTSLEVHKTEAEEPWISAV